MTNKQFMPDVSRTERLALLRENADKIEQRDYYKPLTPDEIAERKSELTENSIQLADIAERKKDAMDAFKEQQKPLVEKNKLLMQEVRFKQAKVSGELFHMANHESGMMETFDESGELIETRRLKPEERQGRLQVLRPAANQ